jgi:prophage antirepressor-like protein
MTIINESGLYSLILRSRKPQAKAFKRWITHDVIPAIRKTGKYATPAAASTEINPNDPLTFRLWDTDIRVFIREGQAWFVATDLAAAAEIPYLTDALRYITDTEKVSCPCGTILSELGTYELLVRSKRTNAAPLRRWIAHTVIPQIRALGSIPVSPQIPAALEPSTLETELRIKEREIQLKDETISILQRCLMQACKSS